METNNFKYDNRIWLGIFFMLGGFLLLGYKMGAPVPEWFFSWPVLLIAIGLLAGIRHGFRNTSWIILVGIGSIFLMDRVIPDIQFHDYLIPIIIIAIGVLFIMRPGHSSLGRYNRRLEREWRRNTGNSDSWTLMPEDQASTCEDFIRINSVFSGVKRTVLSKNFKGGTISCAFGGAEIDMTQADINGKIVLRMEEVFGGIKLMIPNNWVVQNEIDGVFHGVDDKRNINPPIQSNPDKILVLKGSCVFAGIEIRSY